MAAERDKIGEAKAAKYNKRGDVFEQQIVAALRIEFEKQKRDVLGNSQTSNLKGYGVKVTKADKRDYLALLTNWDSYDQTMKDALAPILYTLIIQTGQGAMKDLHLDPSMFNSIAPEVLNYYRARAEKIAVDVNDETEKQLRASISQGIDAGETDDELAARIETIMGAALTYRADRIARTETTRAMGFGDVEAWRQSGLVTAKEFYAVLDERVCPWCSQLDGTIISLDGNFLTLGDVFEADGKTLNVSYGDVPYPPVHTNCRCQVLPVTVPLDQALGAQ